MKTTSFFSLPGLFFFTPVPAASAASIRNFDPGYIISDAEFYDSDSMTAGQVQAFLEDINPNCVPGPTALRACKLP